jgi:hypothetical protein
VERNDKKGGLGMKGGKSTRKYTSASSSPPTGTCFTFDRVPGVRIRWKSGKRGDLIPRKPVYC